MRYCKVQPEASQVNGPQALRGDYCICSCSLSSINDKKWFPVLGFIGSFPLLAVFFIPGCVSLLSKWNLVTRYPVIFNFWVGTGRVLEKKFGTGRVPGSRQGLQIGQLWLLYSFLGKRLFFPSVSTLKPFSSFLAFPETAYNRSWFVLILLNFLLLFWS